MFKPRTIARYKIKKNQKSSEKFNLQTPYVSRTNNKYKKKQLLELRVRVTIKLLLKSNRAACCWFKDVLRYGMKNLEASMNYSNSSIIVKGNFGEICQK